MTNGFPLALKAVLFEFPVTGFDIDIPDWMRFLPPDSTAVCELLDRIKAAAEAVKKMKDCSAFDNMLEPFTLAQSKASFILS